MSKPTSEMQRWFEQAWADWIKPLGALIVAGLGYLAYRFEILGERPAGVALVLIVVLGLLLAGALPALHLVRRGSDRVTIALFALLALGGAAWPTLRVAFSPAPLAATRLTAAQPKATLSTGSDGPYELVVAGRFKQAGASEVEASYALKVEGTGSEDVSGSIARSLHRYRTSRRGGTTTALEEHTEAVHCLPNVRGDKITISTDGIDDQLDGSLDVSLRSAGPRPEIFWALSALAVLLGLVLDVRLVRDVPEEERKTRSAKRELTYLTIVSAMLLVFSINFSTEATPRTLVRSAIGAFFLALLAGGAGGWILASFARLAARPRRRS